MDVWHGSRTSIHNHILTSTTKSLARNDISSTPTPSTTIVSATPHKDKKQKPKKILNFCLNKL